MNAESVPTIHPEELIEAMESPEPPAILDVREDHEVATGTLKDAVHIPLGDLPGRVMELDPLCDWVVVCAHGVRSAVAVQWLKEQGYQNVWNLSGGMAAYGHFCRDQE